MTNTTDPGWSDEVVEEVRRLWGDQLRPVDPERIHPGLSAATRRFLTEVGLPDFEPTWGIECVRDRTDRVVTRAGHDYVVVGGTRGTRLVYGIDIHSDQVFDVHPLDLTTKPVLMNTTVALWALCVGVIDREIISQIGVLEPESAEMEALIERARRFFTAMDPAAMRYQRDQNWHGFLQDFNE